MEPIDDDDVPRAPVPVRVVPLSARTTSEPLAVEGRFAASRAVAIKAPSSGVVEELTVSLGDRVEPGQLLLRIGALAARQRALATESAIELLEAQLAEGDEAMAVVSARPDNPERIKTQEAKLRVLRHKLAQEKIQRERHVLLAELVDVNAPFGGFIAAVNAANGGTIMHGHALIELVEADPVVLVVDVPTWVRNRCEIGSRVDVQLGDVVREGVVSRWSPTANDGVRRMLIDVPNVDSRIAAGERGTALLPVGEREAFFAPRHALRHHDKQIQLHLVEHNRVLVRPVRVYGAGEVVEVAGQLSASQLVIMHADRPLADASTDVILGDH
ncbi:MAG: efflux RND transporter periplasmic adaptor subunit [Sandaracinaceae bacterium]